MGIIVKKHFNKIIIGIAFISVFILGILGDDLQVETIKVTEDVNTGQTFKVPEDYIIDRSVQLFVNKSNYVHEDDTVIVGTVDKIVYAGSRISKFVIESLDKEEYVIAYKDLELISTEILQIKKEDGVNEVKLVFRTGGSVVLAEGENVKLYKTVDNTWSLDKREHIKSEEIELFGEVDDFEFLPTADQKGDVYINNINIKDDNGEIVKVYAHNIDARSLRSRGEMAVYYIGNIFDTAIFDVEEKDDFSLEVKSDEYKYVLKKGDNVRLVKNEKKDYWELSVEIDTNIYEAEIKGFEFGYIDDDITSVDYINLIIDGRENVQMTMMQTGALYAVPTGDYKKIYTYYHTDKVLTDIQPAEGWKMDLYYPDDTVLELSIGTKVWVYKNQDDIWVLDYRATAQEQKEDEDG